MKKFTPGLKEGINLSIPRESNTSSFLASPLSNTKVMTILLILSKHLELELYLPVFSKCCYAFTAGSRCLLSYIHSRLPKPT